MFRPLVLACLVAYALSSTYPAFAGPPPASKTRPTSKATVQRAARTSGEFMRGMKDGATHTKHAIQAKPGRYAMLLGGIAATGGAAHMLGIDPEPIMIVLSGVAFGYQVLTNLPKLRAAKGDARARVWGAEVGWPAFLVVSTSAAGHMVGAEAQVGIKSAGSAGVGRAVLQSATIGVDIPTILQTATVPE